jgi:hypothetical protein
MGMSGSERVVLPFDDGDFVVDCTLKCVINPLLFGFKGSTSFSSTCQRG